MFTEKEILKECIRYWDECYWDRNLSWEECRRETLKYKKELERMKKSMDIKDYTAEAIKTLNYGLVPYGVKEQQIANLALGLAGESGEVVDIIKKGIFHGHGIDKEKIIDELGDVMWYIACICCNQNIDFSEVLERNIAKLRKRYGEEFDPDKSINREEN